LDLESAREPERSRKSEMGLGDDWKVRYSGGPDVGCEGVDTLPSCWGEKRLLDKFPWKSSSPNAFPPGKNGVEAGLRERLLAMRAVVGARASGSLTDKQQ
jgi:hypothetical protein